MVSHSVMVHNSTDGTFWGDRVGSYLPTWTYLAENVGCYSNNETEIMQAWIASYEHDRNLRDERAVYFGSAYLPPGYWTQDFGASFDGDVPFPVDCSVDNGLPLPQPTSTYLPAVIGSIKTFEGLCLDSSEGLGGNLRATICVKGQLTQSWTLTAEGAGFFAQATGTKLCIDVLNESTDAGAPVGLWNCNGNLNQQFMQTANSSWIAFHSGQCLDLPGGGKHKPGTAVQQWQCTGRSNQLLNATLPSPNVLSQPFNYVGILKTQTSYIGLTLQYSASGNLFHRAEAVAESAERNPTDRTFSYSNLHPRGLGDGLCLDSRLGSGGALQVTSCTMSASQTWSLTQRGSYFWIQTTGIDRLCVDVFRQSLNENATVGLYACGYGINQAWTFSESKGLVNLNSGKCLQVDTRQSISQGTAYAVVQRTCDGTDSQGWYALP
ncbi:ricin B lectin domain-containing protein [Zopfochytrium polystomum]|nr:ricin B lectin domain-containing protein [Zopfochytrium polystomum]